MIYTLIFNITSGLLDGTTLVNQTIPAAVDGSGEFQFTVTGNMGGIDRAMLAPLVGNGGFLWTGVGMQIGNAGNVTAGILGANAGNVAQRIPQIALFNTTTTQPPYVERPCYVPPFYRLFFLSSAVAAAAHVIRLDIAPISGAAQAARALRVTRPNLLSPIAFP